MDFRFSDIPNLGYLLRITYIHKFSSVLQDAMGEEENEEEEEEEEEEKEEIEEEPEVGKQLLTSVAEDVFDDQLEAWNVKSSSDIDDRRAFAVASSNVWPGAYAFARDT